MNIEEFVNDYLQEHRHDVLLNPYNGLIDFANAFKEQMMEEAVETTVHLEPGAIPVIEIGVGRFGLKVRDKVKVIIVKEN